MMLPKTTAGCCGSRTLSPTLARMLHAWWRGSLTALRMIPEQAIWQMRKESYIERLRDPRPRAVYGTDTLFTLAENSRRSERTGS
jgi:hypothetical protein